MRSKKSILYFISTNHCRMDCNLSNTFKNNIFAFFLTHKSGKTAFTNCRKLQMSPQSHQKFRKSIFEVKKSIFYFISTNHCRMDCNFPNTFKSNIFAFLRPLESGKTTLADCRKLQMNVVIPTTYMGHKKMVFLTPRSQYEVSVHNIWGKDTSDDSFQVPKTISDVGTHVVNTC